MKLLGLKWQNENLDGPTGALERVPGTRLLSDLDSLTLAIVQAKSLIKETRVTGDQSVRTSVLNSPSVVVEEGLYYYRRLT